MWEERQSVRQHNLPNTHSYKDGGASRTRAGRHHLCSGEEGTQSCGVFNVSVIRLKTTHAILRRDSLRRNKIGVIITGLTARYSV